MKIIDIRIRGGQHHQFEAAVEDHLLKPGVEIHLVRDPENSFDRNAIKAFVGNPEGELATYMIGFVARNHAARLAWRFDNGAVVHRCTVTKIDRFACDCGLVLMGGWLSKEEIEQGKPEPLEDDIPF